MFKRKLYVLLMVLCLSVIVFGQQGSDHRTGSVYVSPILLHYMNYHNYNLLKDGILWGARVGVDLTPLIGLEAFGLRGFSEIRNVTDRLTTSGVTTIKARYDAYGIGVRLNMPGFYNYVPYLSLSGGEARASFDGPITSVNYQKVDVGELEKRRLWIFGVGVEYFITRFFALRFDAQDHFIDRDFIYEYQVGHRKTHNWDWGIGVTFMFGGRKKALKPIPIVKKVEIINHPIPVEKKPVIKAIKWEDSDSDGVPDSMDKEPGTPYGVPVDGYGRQIYSPEQYEIMCLFDFDKSEIKSEFSKALDDLANLTIKTKARLSITGYADQVGTENYNILLAERRAHVVMNYLVSRGVPSDNIELKVYGEYPVNENGDPIAYYQRCVQFKLIK